MIRPGTDPAAAWDEIGRAAVHPRRLRALRARGLRGRRPHGRRRLRRLRSVRERAPPPHPRHHAGSGRRLGRDRGARPSRSPRRIADALDYVGVLAVELFLVTEGGGERLVVNEIAPRVHNSGHWTIERRRDLAVRAACPRRLRLAARRDRPPRPGRDGEPDRRTMPMPGSEILAEPGAHLHLYGKARGPAGPQDGPRHAGFAGKG